jgi:F5/8 type C domain/PKD domain
VPLRYAWNFGDPSIPVSNVASPGLVKFTKAGTYTVKFTVTDALSLADPSPATRTITVTGGTSGVLSRSAWKVKYTDSQELVRENGAAANVFDTSSSSIWHTEWSKRVAPMPHEIQIDLGANYVINGFNYLPRQNMSNGRIANYRFYVSADGVNWGAAVASGRFPNTRTRQTVSFPAVPGRYVRLVALSEVNGKPWTSVADLNVMGY